MNKVSLAKLPDLIRTVLAQLEPKNSATLVALSGELGAGKTTFVQTLAKELGVEEVVQSPTYVLMKRYDISYRNFKHLIHIDAYRLNGAKEFEALKPEQFFNDPTNLVCIEWPERAEGALPKPDLTIKFSSEGAAEGERFIEIEKAAE